MVSDGGSGSGGRCSMERRATPTCSVSRGRRGGEEGRSQSRVEGLGVALTSGGGQQRGLDEIQRGGRVLAPGNWLNELSGVWGYVWFFDGVLKLEEWGVGRKGRWQQRGVGGSGQRAAQWRRRGPGNGMCSSWGPRT
jgi:hypothetical protein